MEQAVPADEMKVVNGGAARRWRRWLTRPWVAAVVVLCAYLLLSLAMDPRGYLGTDTGGKVATLEVMVERGDYDPDIGYWAEDWDPDATLHPLYYTSDVAGRWVNVTTLPVVLVARPLYEAFGYRGALLLPMAGAIAAAFAARAISRRVGDERSGWSAYWIVALASPVTIYALDFWEHTIGLAFMAWALVPLLDALSRGSTLRRGLAAGVLFGAAATTRTEALVFGFVAVGLGCVLMLWAPPAATEGPSARRRLPGVLGFGVSVVAGVAVLLVANELLERLVMDASFRSGRAASTASTAGTTLSIRLEEGLATSVNLSPSLDTGPYLIGVVVACLLVYLAVKGARGRSDPAMRIAAAAVLAAYLLRLLDGPGFVPGLMAATPIAAVGLARAWRGPLTRYLAMVAVGALPLVWLFQFTGGAGPQWAGRYVLASGLVLLVLGTVEGPRMTPWVWRAFVGLSVAITAFGLAWLGQRSHEVAASGEAFSRRPEPVLITTIGHQVREYGAFYGQKLWLTAPFVKDRPRAVELVAEAGYDEFGYVTSPTDDEPPEFDGFEVVAEGEEHFIDGIQLRVVTYRATS